MIGDIYLYFIKGLTELFSQTFSFFLEYTFGSVEKEGKIELIFTISIFKPLNKIREGILNFIVNEPLIFKIPPPHVSISEIKNSEAKITAKCWIESNNKKAVAEELKKKIHSYLASYNEVGHD